MDGWMNDIIDGTLKYKCCCLLSVKQSGVNLDALSLVEKTLGAGNDS